MALIDELKSRLINSIDLTRNLSDQDVYEIITKMVIDEYQDKRLSLKEKMRISRELYNSIRGLDILQDILEDEEITEIMINGYDNIFIERQGKLFRYDGAFSSRERLQDIIQQIVAKANKRVNEVSPIVDTRLSDGSRVNVVLSPIALNGPVVTIRKFPKNPMTMEELIDLKTITEEAAEFLRKLVVAGYNIFISGGTGSGKTTFLNVLSNYIPKHERIITIEDSAELKITGIENLVSLECRQANVEGENEVTIRDLIRTSLRMRPTRIVVGEVRGAETLDMLQAMNTGHDGSLSTGHGNSPADMLTRLETMVLMGTEMPLPAIRSQIASALDVMVHLGRMKDGSRKVLEITEVLGYEDGSIHLSPLFKYQEHGREEMSAGKRQGLLEWTGNRLKNRGKGIYSGIFEEVF
ncbi:MAG: CpaF family protein [Lachnospiraceae bacterium]|nr:CpaF family protein [Lachnospiraceae bacterium]